MKITNITIRWHNLLRMQQHIQSLTECDVLFSVQDVFVASYLPGTLQICKEKVLKVLTVFLYTYPERDGDVSTGFIEDVPYNTCSPLTKRYKLKTSNTFAFSF